MARGVVKAKWRTQGVTLSSKQKHSYQVVLERSRGFQSYSKLVSPTIRLSAINVKRDFFMCPLSNYVLIPSDLFVVFFLTYSFQIKMKEVGAWGTSTEIWQEQVLLTWTWFSDFVWDSANSPGNFWRLLFYLIYAKIQYLALLSMKT